MKIRKLFAAVLALCCMVSMFSVASAEDTIKIGVIGPITGGAAVYGTAVANGAKIAVDEINAKGGMQIILDVQDDEHDPEKGVNAFNTVLDNGAQMILGAVTTAPCIAVTAEAYEERVFMLTPSASSTISERLSINQTTAIQRKPLTPAMTPAHPAWYHRSCPP